MTKCFISSKQKKLNKIRVAFKNRKRLERKTGNYSRFDYRVEPLLFP